MSEKYNHKEIEKGWQKRWKEDKIYEVKDDAADSAKASSSRRNFYALVEFPYPSGNLHIGHWYAFAVPDIFARTKRMQGFNVMFPIGFDAFGLPAENAAIKRGLDPKKWTYENIAYMEKQLQSMGNSFDWSRKVITSDPEYYKWTQWLFLEIFKKGLAYKKKASVNWCPSCNTVLANEQVIAGKCERCGSEVIQKDLEQWFFKITDYAERLLSDMDDLKWPEQIKEAQRNWIGKSEGAEVEFEINHPTPALPQGEGDPKFYTTDKENWRELHGRAVEMRKAPTKTEDILWQGLRRDATGYRFRRQWIIGRFIVDFVCIEKMLIIEVDGDIHDHQKERDEERTNLLEQNGFKVIRFKNEEIENNIVNVLKEIHEDLKALPLGEGLGGVISVFTTRIDTLFGVTYLVVAPEHPWLTEQIKNQKSEITNKSEIEKYIKETKSKTEIERTDAKKVKTGVKIEGVTAINPATGEEVPVFVADYVLNNYGTGAVMAVPAHDERDFEFAKKYNLSIVEVISGGNISAKAYAGEGILVNSEKFDGTGSEEAREKITEKFGEKVVKYKLRDWLLSRQRYWGCPIPVVYDPEGKPHQIPEEHLPWLLPEDVDFNPKGESPLATSKGLKERVEKIFGKGWTPEYDTMDTFVDSSWYFLRYCDPQNKKEPFDKLRLKKWMPVSRYSGGAEHTTMHLLYARFFHKVLFDLGLVNESEPFRERMNRGLILGPDGQKMSKSKGNGGDPDELVEKVGSDTVKMYLAFIGPYNETGQYPWDLGGIVGIRRFLERVWRLDTNTRINTNDTNKNPASAKTTTGEVKLKSLLHKTIKKVTEDIESYKFNTAISAMMIFLNELEKEMGMSRFNLDIFEIFLKLLAPFAPHITEEIWSKMGHKDSIHLEKWPEADLSKIKEEKVIIVVQINGKIRAQFEAEPNPTEDKVRKKALSLPEVQKWLDGKEVRKIIFVPNKIINLVI
ncbi:MAG: leucine--tRNA ligase [Candidatus Zambryskibacteria bacterium RIFCSPLOWO2_01_FULL_39_39]|uniref:Leucine--tRNA ligase n=1 Tax=Candidatus Zambryskibacteria bacterium RIFCSPLOWO2_01_FULL_39_39 TaxID=1802758 RepID=A0A1G2TXC0_9BACT|nr:MAG: leucine--tRNA ligase [Candidatus Zambryskibacteria bacterium RIFCSPHIGHO2_01_FULL_39_63]OHA94942.1 MAG: leucine--tRNA ligase [Candidatus Zambryskibacteria bacterium RIFCSPHIGHO2_02_FULL_39_19]OHA99122.1 MAG: leucine--tRNA ligase [Candidatus Zambryskibacteria bacterium RIFCSPHIGHO2_12_FULL_39_21]OHB01884.1 MAG: leucine--tRNA ligase [Candidatus Zambryskibacteria bacterium RIFCSPLOWO2_01_FULL_39_39]